MTEPDEVPDEGVFPEIAYPERDWGDDEDVPDPVPLVLVSSREGRGDPVEVPNRGAAWRAVVKKATAGGWTCAVTYALAWTADVYGKTTGTVKTVARHTHSVAVRLQRGAERAYCVWYRIVKDDPTAAVPVDKWSFEFGIFKSEMRTMGATEFKARLT